ncbi:hypothetical protein GXY_10504 [Novacetimonas hansenii ATCC 23769]|uniref:Uncharacterized protein n=1 Tax=Novacetimonas hansenii ATCC 23769 TaxID=714995 RepID=D5QG31_NOVHA|nr:hypothetical protein GXY_10504 [Novacetimonas hansenii ATCC 23769]PYD73965.1 hypothetical protein CFR74_00100 [Novacetimonas hansenii]
MAPGIHDGWGRTWRIRNHVAARRNAPPSGLRLMFYNIYYANKYVRLDGHWRFASHSGIMKS